MTERSNLWCIIDLTHGWGISPSASNAARPTYSAGAVLCVISAYKKPAMLKLRTIGLSDYSVLEGTQRIGRIRLATERMQESRPSAMRCGRAFSSRAYPSEMVRAAAPPQSARGWGSAKGASRPSRQHCWNFFQ